MELFLSVVTHPFLWIFIGLVGVIYAILWLVSQKGTLFDITGLIQTNFGLNHVPTYVIRLVWYLWIILFLAMLFSISYALYNIIMMISRPDTKLESLSVSAYALPAMVVPLSALIAFPITVLRQHYNRRQTEAEEEGLITDRINAAVASLGADKIVKNSEGQETTEPNVEVRAGAILALERLAQKNDDVHVQIMEILCSYLRENTKSPRLDEKNDNLLKPREDVQMALTVIGRRTDAKIRLETTAKFRVTLKDCYLDRADLVGANFNGAQIHSTKLRKANLLDTKFFQANLDAVALNGAICIKTKFIMTRLHEIEFDKDTVLQLSSFVLAKLTSVNLINVKISSEQLTQLFADKTVTLLSSQHVTPKHWPDMELDFGQFDTEYKKWVDDTEGYKFDRALYEHKTP